MMRVLFQPRAGAPEEGGGDWVDVNQTITALREFGIESDISTDPAIHLAPYDLVHLFSLAEPRTALRYFYNAARQGKPVVASPIYSRRDIRRALGLTIQGDPRAERAEALASDFQQRVWRLILSHAQRVFPMSQMESELLRQDLGVPLSKQRVRYLGVDPIFYNAPDVDVSGIVPTGDFVLCVARINISKNQLGLIRAWRNETTPLVLIGRIENEDYFEQCKREAGTHIKILASLPTPYIVAAMRAAKVHILASWWEEVGLAALEAAVCGCNLVMTQNGPAREYFRDRVWSCAPNDPASIRGALKDALAAPRSPEWSEWVRATYTWQRTAAGQAAAYGELLAEGGTTLLDTKDECELEALAITLCELMTLKEDHAQAVTEHLVAGGQWGHDLQAQIAARERELAWVKRPAGVVPRRLRSWLRRIR